jgi:hypothetical protein
MLMYLEWLWRQDDPADDKIQHERRYIWNPVPLSLNYSGIFVLQNKSAWIIGSEVQIFQGMSDSL